MNLKYLLATAFGIFLGIIISYQSTFSTQIFLVSLLISLINFLILKFIKPKNNKNKNETTIFIIFLFLSISFGIIVGQVNLSKNISQKQTFTNFVSSSNTFSGTILKINFTENSQQLIVKLDTNRDKTLSKSYKIKLITNKITDYEIEEVLSFTGEFSNDNVLLPDPSETYSQTFNFKNLDLLDGISGTIIYPKIEILETENNLFFKLKNFKKNLVQILDKIAPRSVAALSSGTTLGDKSLFTSQEINSFRYSGLSHIMVLSGFNITILILFFGMIFLTMNIKLIYRVIFSILMIIIFLIIVGADPSILRASIMGAILLLATVLGKSYLAKQGLFISAIIMLILNPKIAPYDVSFHLSFLATLGILYISPILKNYKFFQERVRQSKIIKNILEIFRLTLAVQIIITPYLAYTFLKISLLGIVANILVIPFIPVVMLLTLLIIIFYFIFSPVAIFFSYISYIFSQYIFLIANYFSNTNLSKINSHLSTYTLIIIYILIIFLIYFEDKRLRLKKYFLESQS